MASKKGTKEQEFMKEFHSFLKSEALPPESVSRALHSRVRADLNPAFLTVLLKLGSIQLCVAALTLLFCPQLGVGPVFGDFGLMYLLMHFGPLACTAVCGSLYFGISLLLGMLLIRPEELRKARAARLAYVPIVATLSLSLLLALGAEGTLLFYGVWFLGAVIGGEVSAQVAGRARLL